MSFLQMLDKAVELTGSKGALGRALGINEANMRNVWTGRPLKNKDCAKLAELIGEDVGRVIAAHEEFRAKDEEERSFWHRFSQAAAVMGTALFVTLFVTFPSGAIAAQGASGDGVTLNTHYYDLSRRFKGWLSRRKAALVRSTRAACLWTLRSPSW